LITRLLLDQVIADDSSQVLLRSKLRAVSRRMGFQEAVRERMELVCNEIITNQLKYAGRHGLVQIWEHSNNEFTALDLFALDYGPGIPNLPAALRDGYTTSGTMGKGLGAIQRLSSECEFYTLPHGLASESPWHGVAVWARFYAGDKPRPRRFQCGHFVRAYQDDVYNGDCICVLPDNHRVKWLHADGLGHGKEAAEALIGADAVLDTVTPLDGTLQNLSRRLRGGRGAVAMACEIDFNARTLHVCGVGDMGAFLVCNGERRVLNFSPGVLGHEHRSFELIEQAFPQQALLITASDGLRRNWGLSTYPGLWRLHPQLIALLLGNVTTRNNDDKSIFVVRTTPLKDEESGPKR
jgi:anti-sigma regulatory factor (Ser/Thr protein kinase)